MATSFGGAVKLTGESEYRKALKNITQSLKEVTSEMKLVTAQYDKNDNSTEALSAKSKVLTERLELQKQKVETLKKQYEAMASQYDKNTAKNEALARKYEEEKAKLSEIESALGKTSNEYQEQADKVADLSAELKKSEANQEANTKALSDMRIQLNNAETDTAKTTREIEQLSREMDGGASSADRLGDEVEKAGNSAESANGGFTVFKGALADFIANVVTNAISKLKDLAKETINVGATFDSAMANVSAISGATGDDLDALRAKAKEMGETTKFSATESADAFSYMAMAGWKTQDMLDGIAGIMQLASASGADLATASDIVTDALTGFGESADQAGRLADIMATASSNANTNVELMGETFKYVTPVAGAMGYSMEDTALAIGLMANSGIKGTQAGTALRSIMVRLSTDAGKTANSLGALGTLTEKLGVEFYNADGTARDLADVLGDTRVAWANLSAEQQTNYAKTIAGQEAMAGWLAIMNASEADFNKLSTAIDNSTGSAEKMADVMINNLSGDMTLLNSHLESVQIAIYEKFEPALRAGVEVLNKLLDAVMYVVDHSSEFIAGITAMATAMGTYLAYTTALKVMKDGWTALTLVTKAQTLAQTALNAVMSANPIGLVIALIAGLVAGFVVLWNKSEAFRNFFIGMWDGIKNAVGEAWESITGFFSGAWDKITAMWSNITSFFSNLWSGVKDAGAKASDGIAGFFSSAKDKVTNTWGNVTNFFSGVWDGIKNVFGTVAEWFKTYVFEPIMDYFRPTLEFYKTAFEIIFQLAKGCWELIKVVWEYATTWFNDSVVTPIKEFFINLWSDITTSASTAWEFVKTLWANACKSISEFFTNLWNDIKEGASKAWEFVKSIWQAVSSWYYDNVIAPVLEFYTAMWNGIKEGASTAWEFIKGVWEVVSGWFNSTIVAPVTNYFKTMWSNLVSGAKSAWNGIKSVFSVVSNWFKDVFTKAWTNVKNVFSTGGKIFTGIVDGITNAFKTVVNAIIRGINKVVAMPFNAINNALDTIRNVSIMGVQPFSGLISRFNVPQIPLLAKGGIVDGATFIAGEQGKEAIIPLERNTGWISKVAQEIAQIIEIPLQGLAENIKGMQVPQTQSTDYTYNDVVNAFKDALGQMKIVLDDEEMGHFVEKTVADAIYT